MVRVNSPAQSEDEIDIFASLCAGDDDGAPGILGQDLGTILHPNAADDDGDEAFIALKQAASFRKGSTLKGRTVKKGGGFQVLGLNPHLLKAITRKGYSVPTPIQRKAIPLILDRHDVVGMARTGSGKTAAFVIPMMERLRSHSATVGARALILSPSRELAIQTLKVVREFSRGSSLKSVLLVGGDSLEEQFGSMTSNPDIIIATPGRFLHLKVEMSLDLTTIQYVVFDEADRLFEMGFATQLTEILHALPLSRQTLLFSATLPQSLVEFARAGLQDPSLVRLDAETKISQDLQSAFISAKGGEKEAAILCILHDVIKMPPGLPVDSQTADASKVPSKKRKRGRDDNGGKGKPSRHSTIIFTATKHHVEYLAMLLRHAGFAVSYVYGALDQTARRIQVDDFRQGRSNILVVTDVAARGIDIPVLANVINYDFPAQPKLFIHRVGRTARAGQRGWSYSLVRDVDCPYLLDLQLFLGRELVLGNAKPNPSYSSDIVVGALPRPTLETHMEWVAKVLDDLTDISALSQVAVKAERLYMKTRTSASTHSARRARITVSSPGWTHTHPVFVNASEEDRVQQQARADMLARISGFRPTETIFELSSRGKSDHSQAAEMMKRLRKKIVPRRRAEHLRTNGDGTPYHSDTENPDETADLTAGGHDASIQHEARTPGRSGLVADEDTITVTPAAVDGNDDDDDNDDGLEVTVSHTAAKSTARMPFQDTDVFMSYTPRHTNAVEERGFGVHSGSAGDFGSSFVQAARSAALDLTNDEAAKAFGVPSRPRMRWDKKDSKYVSTAHDDPDGSRSRTNARMIRGESGVMIAASFQSGRFDRWRKAHRLPRQPRPGEPEPAGRPPVAAAAGPAATARHYKHKLALAPKEADRFRDNFLSQRKRVQDARDNRVGRFKNGAGSKKELKDTGDIRRARKEKQRRKDKNTRMSHGKK